MAGTYCPADNSCYLEPAEILLTVHLYPVMGFNVLHQSCVDLIAWDLDIKGKYCTLAIFLKSIQSVPELGTLSPANWCQVASDI